jgi:hypothetical protein
VGQTFLSADLLSTWSSRLEKAAATATKVLILM